MNAFVSFTLCWVSSLLRCFVLRAAHDKLARFNADELHANAIRRLAAPMVPRPPTAEPMSSSSPPALPPASFARHYPIPIARPLPHTRFIGRVAALPIPTTSPPRHTASGHHPQRPDPSPPRPLVLHHPPSPALAIPSPSPADKNTRSSPPPNFRHILR